MSNPQVKASWNSVPMPPHSQDRNWKMFCYGVEEEEEVVVAEEEEEQDDRKAEQEERDVADTISQDPSSIKRKRKRGYGENGQGYYPEYHILGQIDQVTDTNLIVPSLLLTPLFLSVHACLC